MYSGMFDGFEVLVKGLLVALLLSVPLAIWKLVECIAWLGQHVDVVVK